MRVLFIPDIIKRRLTQYFSDIEEQFGETVDKVYDQYLESQLFGEKLDVFRNSSFWVLPNGKLYPIREGCHAETARYFLSVRSDLCYVNTEDFLSEVAVRYSKFIGFRLPDRGATQEQQDTISDLSSHPEYHKMMEELYGKQDS